MTGLADLVHDADRPADVGLVLLQRVHAQRQADGRQEVRHGHGPLLHHAAVLAGLADHLAALDAAAGQDGAPAVGEVVAALLRVDLRRAAELAHPDDQRRVQQSAVFQVAHQGRPRGVEHPAQALYRIEIVGVRVPAEAAAVEAAQRHLDERHAALHQPAGQQAALAEQVAAVGVAQRVLLVFQVERPAGVAAHEPDGLVVGRQVARRRPRRAGSRRRPFPCLRSRPMRASRWSAGTSRGGSRFCTRERTLGGAWPGCNADRAAVADDQRGEVRPEEAGAVGERAGRAVRGDAHEARQHGVAVDQFLGDERAEGRVLDLVLGQRAGVHQLGRPRVFALLGGHGANDRHAVGEFGDLREGVR